MRFNTSFRFLDKMWLVHIQSMTIPIVQTSGMSARVAHSTEYVIFLDYDVIKDESLIDRLAYLQERYGLGDFHILTTNQYGRHAVCIDRLHLRKALRVVADSNCDQVFQRGIRINEFRTWILRTEGKGERPAPKYLYSLESDYNGQNLQSQAHGIYLQDHFGAKVRLTNPDGNIDLELQDYKTSSKTKLKDVEHTPISFRQLLFGRITRFFKSLLQRFFFRAEF